MAIAAGAYLYWQSRNEGQGQAVGGGQGIEAPAPLGSASEWVDQASFTASDRLTDIQAQYAPQQSGGSDMKFNFAPILSWAGKALGGLFNNDPKDGGWSGSSSPTRPSTNWNNDAQSGADAGLGGASAGGSARNNGTISALQQVIGEAEAPQGYNQVYGGSRIQPPRPITTMTVGEVRDWQNRSVNAGSPSSAAGRYQVIGPTLQGLIDQGVVSPNDTFDAATQDKISVALMERRGLRDYEAGRISATTFGQRLSQEWAGLPAFTRDRKGRKAQGQSYYAGDGLNAATTTKDRVMRALTGSGGWV